MPSLDLRSITRTFSVFTPATSYLAGVRWSVGCFSQVAAFVISLFAIFSLYLLSLFKEPPYCIIRRGFPTKAQRRTCPVIMGVWSTILNTFSKKKKKETVAIYLRCNWRMWGAIMFFFPPQPPAHTEKATDQNTNTKGRTNVMWQFLIYDTIQLSGIQLALSLHRLNFHFLAVSLHVQQPTLTF